MEQFAVDSLDELADVPVETAANPQPPQLGTPHDQPIVLVCTHASRDQCCAIIGRPIATALAARLGDCVFETSHVGGHRFAGNVVCLPSGLVLGGLDPQNAVTLVGEVAARSSSMNVPPTVLPFVRGRSCLRPHEQVAELAVARQIGVLATAVDSAKLPAAANADSSAPADDPAVVRDSSGNGADILGRYRVVVQADGREFVVAVHQRQTGEAVVASCGDDTLTPVTRFDPVLVEQQH